MLHFIYTDIIYRPLLNLLIFFYHYIPDIGVVIVLLTLLIRLILAPSFHKSLKSQSSLSALQPKLNELREKYKDNKEGQAKAMMELYKEHKINPFSSCLPLLIQLPILIALYQVFVRALNSHLTGLYSFVSNPGTINPYFLKLIDLSRSGYGAHGYYWPALVLGVLAGATQFWQSKLMMPKASGAQDTTTRVMSLQTTYILPIISVVIAVKLPAGLPLYWVVTTLFAVAQQYYIMRKKPNILPNTN